MKQFAAICLTLASFALVAADASFKPLFNGKDLTGWDGDTNLWSVQDGVIVGETTAEKKAKGNTFLVWREGKPKDFHLKCKFKLEGSNNSGVQYRSVENPKWVMSGYQCDLQYGAENMCKLYHEKNPRGRVCMSGEVVTMEAGEDPKKPKKNVTGKTPDAEKLATASKKGEWNDCEIIAKGNHVIHKINGVVAIDFTDNDEKNRCLEGLLALQIHAGAPMKISFKDIEYAELKD